jgi:hypothetical protein
MSPGFLGLVFFAFQMKPAIARRIASAVMLTTIATTILTFFFDLLTEAAQEIVKRLSLITDLGAPSLEIVYIII